MKWRVLVSIVEPVTLPYLGLDVPVVWIYLVGNVISQYPFHFISIISDVFYSPCFVGINNIPKHRRILHTTFFWKIIELALLPRDSQLWFKNYLLQIMFYWIFLFLQIKEIPYIIFQSKKSHKLR